MAQALWVAKTGLDAQHTRMSIISHNLANVNTTGFKRGRGIFHDLLYQTVRQPGASTSSDSSRDLAISASTAWTSWGTTPLRRRRTGSPTWAGGWPSMPQSSPKPR